MKFAKYWESIELDNPVSKSGASFWVSGASNESPGQARINAQNRLLKLRLLIESGFTKRDEYEYWSGFVREEILEQVADGDSILAVLTRNNYGAVILNTEKVVFGDIDIPPPTLLQRLGLRKKSKEHFIDKIRAYQQRHPELAIRVYETYSGLRFALTNTVSPPESEFVRDLFSALDVDPLYARLCRQQSCFRARLTPKPWRIGMDRPGGRFPRRNQSDKATFDLWLEAYRQSSTEWAAARLVETFGSQHVGRDILHVINLHDKYACGMDLKLA